MARPGREEAEAFVSLLEGKVEQKFVEKRETLATKEELANLRAELLRTYYLVSLGQLMAIVGAVLAILTQLR